MNNPRSTLLALMVFSALLLLVLLVLPPALAKDEPPNDINLSPRPDDLPLASPVVATPAQYWGNSFSLKFHRPSCPFAQAMNPIHVQFFQSRHAAIEQGERPCRYCLPPYWTSVHCVLLTKPSTDNTPSRRNEPLEHDSEN